MNAHISNPDDSAVNCSPQEAESTRVPPRKKLRMSVRSSESLWSTSNKIPTFGYTAATGSRTPTSHKPPAVCVPKETDCGFAVSSNTVSLGTPNILASSASAFKPFGASSPPKGFHFLVPSPPKIFKFGVSRLPKKSSVDSIPRETIVNVPLTCNRGLHSTTSTFKLSSPAANVHNDPIAISSAIVGGSKVRASPFHFSASSSSCKDSAPKDSIFAYGTVPSASNDNLSTTKPTAIRLGEATHWPRPLNTRAVKMMQSPIRKNKQYFRHQDNRRNEVRDQLELTLKELELEKNCSAILDNRLCEMEDIIYEYKDLHDQHACYLAHLMTELQREKDRAEALVRALKQSTLLATNCDQKENVVFTANMKPIDGTGKETPQAQQQASSKNLNKPERSTDSKGSQSRSLRTKTKDPKQATTSRKQGLQPEKTQLRRSKRLASHK